MIRGLSHSLGNSGKEGFHLVRTSHEWASVFNLESVDGRPVRVLDVGGAFQSATYLDGNRSEPVFEYYRAFDEAFACGIPIRHALMIGGGGCAWPKHAATNHPELVVDVVEEDALVIDIARKFFFVEEFERTGQLRMIAADGRAYLEQPGPAYDAIVNDAFSGTEPVRSLATIEAAHAIARRLNPGGVYLSNVVSENGGVHIAFLRDAAASLAEVFSNVQVLPCPDFGYSDEDNYLLAASNSEVSFEGALPFSDEFIGTPLRD